jgi:diguanylate cyclase (GGDEF)-like protein
MIWLSRLPSSLARWWALLCLSWCASLLALPHAQAVPLEIALSGSEAQVSLGMNAQVLEDAPGHLQLQDVRQRDRDWSAFHSDTFNFGFSKSVWWARIRLHHTGSTPIRRMLDVGTALQDEIDWYVVKPDGAVVQHVLTGDRHPFASRPIHTRVPTFQIDMQPGEVLDLYIRLSSHDGLQEAVSLKLWHPDAHVQALETETLAFGLYFGALGTVLLYNLFLFLSTRQRSFGWYSAYVAAFLFWGLIFRGYAFQYWWPDAPNFNNQILPLAAAASYCLFGVFMVSYLHTGSTAPRLMHRIMVFALVGNVLCVTPAVFNHYALSFALSIPFGVTQIIMALTIGALLAWRGYRPARFFVTAFFLLAVGVVLYYLRVLGAVPSNIVTENFLQIGSALEVLLLAFGLADQMNTLRLEKLRAERQALAAQEALNTELESLVKRRTRALEAANQRLAEMAITDELTGAFNRRHFNSAFEADVARHRRNGTPVAFCMLDIDQFKAYNDRYGHVAGDAVLQRVAQVITGNLQRAGDQFFRLGGEEFGILLSVDHPADKIVSFIDKIRADIEALGITHELAAHQVITASFGLVWAGPESKATRPEDVYAAADELLYQAKSQGRNRVVSRSM